MAGGEVSTVIPGPGADVNDAGSGAAAARKQIRGSGLLLVGRIFSVAAKTGAQVLVVRYLTTADYGSWAYALAAVAFLGGFAHLSLDRAVARFASIYHEEKQYDRFFGVIALVLVTVALTGTLFVATFHMMPDLLSRVTGGDARVVGLLLVMIFLVPLEALDTLLIALFAVFARPRAIFVRRYIITPAVQVSLVLLLIGLSADVQFLAYGYVAGTLIGVLVSLWLLFRILQQQQLLRYARPGRVSMPIRELFGFSAPLMTSDWLTVLTHSSGALVLGYLYTSEHVALFRVVMPLAALNQLVIQSFHVLYIPTAARLFARGDRAGMNDLYWRTSLWIAVLTFPLFALTFAAATPLTVLFFGARYEAAGAVLAVLVIGQYVQAALGFNGATIKVLGRVRMLVMINVTGALINIVLTVLLVPWLGVMGAAIAMSATLIIHNVLKQLALTAASGFPLLDRRYAGPVRTIAAGAATLLILPVLGVTSSYVLFGAAAAVTALVLADTRHKLAIGEVFPELARHPLVRRLLA
jgi:O-antigen/teichoic acid export membrane protein